MSAFLFTVTTAWAAIIAMPPSIDFGSVGTGTTSSPQSVIVSQKGAGKTLVKVKITGTNASSFSATPVKFTVSKKVGTQDVEVSFSPTTEGPFSATVKINSQTVTLTGSGVPPTPTPTPTPPGTPTPTPGEPTPTPTSTPPGTTQPLGGMPMPLYNH